MSLNVSEYGLACNLNVNFDLSTATSLTMSFTRPDGTVFTGAAIAPGTPATSPNQGTFSANKYARYIFKESDLTVAGEYIVRLMYLDSSKRIFSEPTSFMVYP